MSETWADAQFDMLEAAYDEVPIEAKARIAELEAQHCPYVRWWDGESYCDCTAYVEKLKALVRDMDYCLLNHMSCDQCEIRPCRLGERVKELGLRKGGAR